MQDFFSPKTKKYAEWMSFILLIGLALSSFAFAFWYEVSGWKTARDKITIRQILVTGEGKVAVKPDLVIFTAGVVTDAAKVKDAQLENTRRSNVVIGFLKQKGLEEKDIKTTGYSIYPQYSYPEPCPRGLSDYASYPCPLNTTPKIKSYQVRHTVEVKVRDLNKTDEFLDGAVSNGANQIGSVSFSTEDEEKVRVEARKKAINNAEEKARVLTKDLGVRLGKIINFSESGNGYPIYARALGALGKGGDVAPASSPQIEPGEQEISSTVTITYEFR